MTVHVVYSDCEQPAIDDPQQHKPEVAKLQCVHQTSVASAPAGHC